MKPYILRNVKLDPRVEAFASEHYTIIEVSELNDENAKDIDVLLTNGTGKAPKELLDRLPSLKLIDDFGVGFDGVDIEECKRRGIAVCTTPGVLTEDVADLALSLLMASSRRVCAASRFVNAGSWQPGKKFGLAHQVSGKKVGIVGLGRIGRAVAQRCAGFDMQICYFDGYVTEPKYQKFESLVELAREVDFLVICAAATAANRALISEEVMRALGPEGTLVNVARGSLVDEKAMTKLIEEGSLGSVALDVFEAEPHVPESLLGRDNVIFTPHIASATVETRQKMAEIVIGNLKAYREGTPLLTPLFK